MTIFAQGFHKCFRFRLVKMTNFKDSHPQLSQDCFAFIKRSEGLRLKAYQDQRGVWTIGYGHTGDVKPGMIITQDQADEYLQDDVAWAMVDVLRVCPSVRGHQLDALVSFVYNIGPRQWQSSTLAKVIANNKDDYARIHKEWRRWVFVNKIYNLGLVSRRERELKLYCGSYYVRP